MDEGLREMSKGFKKMDEMTEKRHKEVLSFLKKGFGEVIKKSK